MLVAKGGIALALTPDLWFERFCDLPGVTLAAMPPSVLVASTILPGQPPGDPADRILIATARAFGYVLVTRDEKILEYGAPRPCTDLGVLTCVDSFLRGRPLPVLSLVGRNVRTSLGL